MKRLVVALLGAVVLSILGLNPTKCVFEYQDFAYHAEARMSSLVASVDANNISWYIEATNTFNYTSTPDIDMGRQAQMAHGYPMEPVSTTLPQRLFVIYGLESSGTTFMAKTIAKAVGIEADWSHGIERMTTDDLRTQVHHISLPLGAVHSNHWGFDRRFSEPLPIVPVYYPAKCDMKPIMNHKHPPTLQSPLRKFAVILWERRYGLHHIDILST